MEPDKTPTLFGAGSRTRKIVDLLTSKEIWAVNRQDVAKIPGCRYLGLNRMRRIWRQLGVLRPKKRPVRL